jgi:hypothetical protein
MVDPSSTHVTGRAALGGGRPAARPLANGDDETDYRHRHFVNLVAAAFLLVIAIAIVWTIKAMDAYEKQRVCIDSGRRECVQLEPHRHFGIRPAAR